MGKKSSIDQDLESIAVAAFDRAISQPISETQKIVDWFNRNYSVFSKHSREKLIQAIADNRNNQDPATQSAWEALEARLSSTYLINQPVIWSKTNNATYPFTITPIDAVIVGVGKCKVQVEYKTETGTKRSWVRTSSIEVKQTSNAA